MIPLLTELSEYLERHADTRDTAHGPVANLEMLLKRDVDAEIERLKIAAQQPSTATVITGPSKEGLGQGDAAGAATTPRTDAMWTVDYPGGQEKVPATFARQLEREIAAMKHDLYRAMANHVADMNASPGPNGGALDSVGPAKGAAEPNREEKVDAERYRRLRNGGAGLQRMDLWTHVDDGSFAGGWALKQGEALDDALDATREISNEEKS
jgi:hypothetical protein